MLLGGGGGGWNVEPRLVESFSKGPRDMASLGCLMPVRILRVGSLVRSLSLLVESSPRLPPRKM